MSYHELPPKRTPVEPIGIVNALLVAWPGDCTITRAGVEIAAAQVGVETNWQGCMNYNLAGAKSKPNSAEHCWQYFATTEYFDSGTLARAHVLAVDTGAVKEVGASNGKVKVMLCPKHPWCCFKAFESMRDAISEHLAFLRSKFPKAFEVLCTPDATTASYAKALQHGIHGGYYTCTAAEYAHALDLRLAFVRSKTTDPKIWGDVQ